MEKRFLLLSFLFFISHSYYQMIEITEYPIRDIRLRKKLNFNIKSIEVELINLSKVNCEQEPLSIEIIDDAVKPQNLADFKKPIAMKQEKQSTEQRPHDQDSENDLTKTEQKKIITAPLVLEKQKPLLQKEINQLTVEPFLTKRSDLIETHAENTQSKITITVHNNINTEMITYHHWSGKYSPEFSISINEQTVPSNGSITIPVEQSLKIEYSAQFPYGYSSKDSIEYCPKESIRKIIIEFDWHASPRIIVNEVSE